MKLRLRHNSIRLRLSQSEVTRFLETGSVEESIVFGTQESSFKYRLISAQVETVCARIENNCISVVVPANIAKKWASGISIGIEHSHPLDEQSSLRILIEKDFACMEPRAVEEDVDAFPHPDALVNASGPS